MKKTFSRKISKSEEHTEVKEFNPTQEQVKGKELIQRRSMVKIGAPAGSGKSSSLYYFGRENPEHSLGLVFNKSMAIEAQAKSPSNIIWKTTHSLAYSKYGSPLNRKLSRPRGKYVNVAMTGSEISQYFKLSDMYMVGTEEYISKAFIGLLIKETVNSFEVSVDQKITKENLPHHQIEDLYKRYGKSLPKNNLIKLIYEKSCDLWEERINVDSDVMCTHNTYLKLYQLSKPDLSTYKVIYCDEAQDINPATMDIILNQRDKCKIVWIGDKYQSIYQFNGAVNAMDKIDCVESHLTKSFRFGNEVANIARKVLGGKLKIVGNENLDSKVSKDIEVIDTYKPYTILFRTNMELIYNSMRLITEGKSVNVNVDLRDFTLMVKSAEALHVGNFKQIKHQNILPFTRWEDLVEEGKSDKELNRVVSIVENGDTEEIISTLHTHNNEEGAHITLTTAHKSKGLEWDQVILGEDFPSIYDKNGKFVGLKSQEENLLYVACTRASLRLQYNSTVQELLDLEDILIESEFKNE